MWRPRGQTMVTFQILSVAECDRVCAAQSKSERTCVVILTGRTQEGAFVTVVCDDYRPALKVLASDTAARTILEEYTEGDDEPGSESRAATRYVRLYDFDGYSPTQKQYVQVAFRSNMDFMVARKKLRTRSVRVYDGSLGAGMQMLADLALVPCAWVDAPIRCDARYAAAKQGRPCALAGHVGWRALTPSLHAPETSAPFRIMAFDIECHSSHGDFPCAQKGYERLARELATIGDETLGDSAAVSSILSAAFDTADAPASSEGSRVSKVFLEAGSVLDSQKLKVVARDIADHYGRGKGDAIRPKEMQLAYHRSLPGSTGKSAGQKPRSAHILKVLSAADLPKVAGDPLIQIGASVRALGSAAESDENTIFVLGDCDDLEGTDVLTFTSEADLIRAFLKFVRASGPDFVTGYNTFGFDWEYIVKRSEEVGVDVNNLSQRLDPSAYDNAMVSSLIGGKGWIDARRDLVVKKDTADHCDTYLDLPGRVAFDLLHVIRKEHSLTSYKLDHVARHFTGESKDDITPAQIFASHAGSAGDRALVAKYCIQDCRLVLHLASKLNSVNNAIGMAHVCSVPVSWIFLRGQGAKILSLVSRQCKRDGFALPAMGREQTCASYEGATVLDPLAGAYLKEPVVVLDFASLYPSSMISHNISHDTFLEHETTDTGAELDFHLNLGQLDKVSGERVSTLFDARATAAYVRPDVREGVVPRILRNLLSERKRVRGLIKSEPDVFKKAVLDGLQLAFKVTANSLYGQLGAPTSPVFKPELAASTTAVGRQMLEKLRVFATDECEGKVVYGDTDSVFITFPKACPAGDARERLAACIARGEACSTAFRDRIPQPHNAEYEKTFWPFVLLSKKRYVGNMVEQADSVPVRKSMGIVLRRRDNADIVKRIYGGVIDRVMAGDVPGATSFARDALLQLVNGDIDISELTVTKTLRAESAYVDADKIAHVVLARRMNEREPGSAPSVGERMPYVYVEAPSAKLQGDRVEHPDYVGNKKVDVMFYITNQLTKPLTQLFEVLIDHVPGARATLRSDAKTIKREVHRAVFEPAVNDAKKVRAGLQSITSFFVRR